MCTLYSNIYIIFNIKIVALWGIIRIRFYKQFLVNDYVCNVLYD